MEKLADYYIFEESLLEITSLRVNTYLVNPIQRREKEKWTPMSHWNTIQEIIYQMHFSHSYIFCLLGEYFLLAQQFVFPDKGLEGIFFKVTWANNSAHKMPFPRRCYWWIWSEVPTEASVPLTKSHLLLNTTNERIRWLLYFAIKGHQEYNYFQY